MAFRVVTATDAMETSEQERHLARVATPLAKFLELQTRRGLRRRSTGMPRR
jgi:hypothetical protein